MTYATRRRRVFELACEMGELIREAGDRRNELWACANDDLADAVAAGAPKELREAFTDAARDYWLRGNQMHSVKVPERPPFLRLVSEEEFEQMANMKEPA